MTTREVVLEGGAPWGFRMHGGVDQNQPLRISRVNPGSKAAHKGIREGDLISTINGRNTKYLTNNEAHGLLRNAGEILKLGLNEDPNGSPKRRQYRTIHQETLQETVKRSSVTSYSVTRTVETVDSQPDKDNENSIDKNNGHSSINGTSKSIPPSNLLVTKKSSSSSSSSPTLTKDDLKTLSSDNALASQRSSYTNCTLSPSSLSIFSEDGICRCTPGQDITDTPNRLVDNMNDNQSSSRSRKRRQRRKNRKITESLDDNITRNTNDCDNPKEIPNEDTKHHVQEEYTVQSPVELSKNEACSKKITKPVKSRSLDDDEMVNIQEVSEFSETEDKEKEAQAIVSEASESEVEWEETSQLDTPPPVHGSLSTFTLPLEGYSSEQITLISPEDEKNLREFLDGLNLVNGPEAAANQVYDPDSPEGIKQRKAQKKAELAQYFLPIYQNPRYLEVISEENSDRDSDREQSNLTRLLRKTTPEEDASARIPPKVPPRQNRERRKMLSKFTSPIEQPAAVLVDTKIIDTTEQRDTICSSFITGEEAKASNVEIVYIASSETDSAEESESNSSDSYALGSEQTSSNEDLSEKTLVNVKTDQTETNTQDLNITNKKHYKSKHFFEDIQPNETMRTVLTSQCQYTVKSNKIFNDKDENMVNIDLLSQLTPPPTPDNISPNDTKCKESVNTSLDTLVCPAEDLKEDNVQIEAETPDNISPNNTQCKESVHTSLDILVCPAEDVKEDNVQIEAETPDNISLDDTKCKNSVNTSLNILVCPAEDLKEDNSQIEAETRTNVISPPPPSRSPSSSRSSSRGSSLSTARYIPTSSSITDVIALTKDIDTVCYQALTLREICLKFLLSLPFGKEVLEELADVSKCIESYTRSLPSTFLPKLVPNLAQFVNRAQTNSNTMSYNLSVHLPPEKLQGILEEHKLKEKITLQKERIIPITVDENGNRSMSTYNKNVETTKIDAQQTKAYETNKKEVIVPIKIEKEGGKNNTTDKEKTVGRGEFIIPTRTEEENVQNNEKSSNIFKKEDISKTRETVIKKKIVKQESQEKSKEFIIPIAREAQTKELKKEQYNIKLESDTEATQKEFIVPIIKEENVKLNTQATDIKVKEINSKEFIIPIKKLDSEIGKQTKKKSQEFVIPITKQEPEEELNSKEYIITIKKLDTDSGKQTKKKPEEFVIPITKQGLESKKNPAEFIISTTRDEKTTETSKIMDEPKEVTIPIFKEWTGMPTERDPKLLLCLSPKQKDQLEKGKQVPDEAAKLIDLHEKFINRRTSHEEFKKESQEKVTITTSLTPQPPCNRLLTIIREEPSASKDEKDFLYYLDKGQSCTLPRDSARLNAKDLAEWLNLARNKSMSESNLTTVPDIPENNLRNNFNKPAAPIRRTSLPPELFEKQMIYIQEKEREIQRQLEALEEEKRLLNAEMTPSKEFHAEDYHFSRKGDFAESKKRLSLPMMPTEYFRQQMYEEYMDKFAEREERKQHKIIKVTSSKDLSQDSEAAGKKEIVHPIQLEDEFMHKVKELQSVGKLEKVQSLEKDAKSDKEDDEPPVLVMDGEKLKEAKELPKHLQEFVGNDGIWSPGQTIDFSPKESERRKFESQQDESIPPVWTPKSANSSPVAERKEFRPVNFQSPVLGRRNRTTSENLGSQNQTQAPPWKNPDYNSDSGSVSTILERRLTTSRSTPASGFPDFSSTSRLPRAQNPTITLLQKAREGQLPKGASYLEQEPRQFRPKSDRPPIAGPGEVLYQIKNEYTSESDNEKPRKMTDLGPRKFEGIGPVTKDGLPLVLRSEVKDQNQSKWYKRMYDTIHKQKPHNDEYVTVRYKQKRAQYPYTSGYLSEPEPGAYDSDFTDYKYQTLDRRRPPPQDRSSDYVNSTMPRPTVNRSFSSDIGRNTQDYSRPHPGRIENYTPGHSSIAEKETKQWWDEVMDIFDGHLDQQNRQAQSNPKSFINQALKESGYESDSTLVFRRREETAQLSPIEQREAYKTIQKGGDVPLHGLRKPAPERPKETDFVEFFPISPTLTRIRIHKNIKPQKEVICYPVTVHHDAGNTFSAYKRTLPSSAIPTPPPIPTSTLRPPSPPRRKSSRNNPTLRLVSTMKVKSAKPQSCKRHETCFTTTSNIEKSKVNYLRDKITCKVSSPTLSKRSTSPHIRVVKKVTASPDLKNKITSTLTTSKDPRTSARTVQSKTNIHDCISRSRSTDSVPKTVKSKKSPVNSSMESLNLMRSSPKTFGSEKKKFDLTIKPPKLIKSPDLISPTEVKKANMMNLPSRKSSPAVSASRPKTKESVKLSLSDRSRPVSKTGGSTSPRLKRSSPSPSTSSSTRVKSSLESLVSPKMTKKKSVISSKSKTKERSSQKSKKEQINDEIKKDTRSNRGKDMTKNYVAEFENAKKSHSIRTRDEGQSRSMLQDIRKQKEAIETNHFFQNLFLRDLSPTPSNASRTSWIVEKTNQLHRRRSSFPEPSISAMKVYLKHTKPVTDSKFISLDMAMIRSRSASPKSVTFEDKMKEDTKETPKRSSSLPAKLIFSQTSRPISPVVHHRKFVSPPPSPKLCRSPSCRRIMQYKNLQVDRKQPEYTLYMCPSINHSTTSLDSLKSEDYYKYFNEVVHNTKFKDLNHFYSDIEKVGQLERSFNVKPRGRSEAEIIDFDRWKEVRIRERAERELEYLYGVIKREEKAKGFLYMPKDVNKYRWKKEYDIGLRVKEKSVDDIKDEFERIKYEESERENSRRRELAFLKDTYKPLWRGFSVANIASNIGERRSHSEGRIKTARQKLIDSEKLLNHGIGSRIWSSLSMEQVNILKDQLAEIYNNYPKTKDYSIHVPKDKKKVHVPTLTVRRNSDSSDHIYRAPLAVKEPDMSENDKKVISYTLSKELLDKIAKQRKLALPVVVGKEVLGAVATADANVQFDKQEAPKKPLVKTNALTNLKMSSTSETESASTDESTKTVICVETGDDIKKKVEYFEHAKEQEPYIPTIYKPLDSNEENGDTNTYSTLEEKAHEKLHQSKSCQSLKEFFGEKNLMKFATIPLSASRRQKFSPKKPELRAIDISPIRSEISLNTSNDSLSRSRSISPYLNVKPPVKTGEVTRLKNKFEYLEDIYGSRTLKRSRSESDINNVYQPQFNFGHVDNMRRKYEYPAYAGRGRSRTRRGGMVSPLFLRAEDRFMPHINIISKIASLYTRKSTKNGNKKHQRSIEELAELLGCPVGEVEKLKEKFDSQEDISLMGHMYTSSPSIRELKDIAPYLTADWTAHRYPKYEDNTRSLSSPEHSVGSRDTSGVRKDRPRAKSTSPPPKSRKSPSILKSVQKSRSTDFLKNQKYDPKIHEPVARYQPNDAARYRNGWNVCSKPTVSFKDPEPPVPPPKGQSVRSLEQESPRKYVENEVTIHYKTPVRQEIKDYLSEDELAHRQAEAMKKIYQEERRKKYLQVSKSLQELQDMNSRRHTDNFIPSQKSPISLNRYDDFNDLAPNIRPRTRSPEHRLCARALYNFVGQSARELTFRKGDIIYLRRQIDKNWYEGELNAMVGLFPSNYVEIIPFEGSTKAKSTLRKAHEGQARAKYNFVAQTHLELSLAKGELVVVTRKIDDNWFEGKIGGRKGIFPSNYVEMLIDPQSTTSPAVTKPVASPAAHSLLLNGSSGGKESMGPHSYTPSLPNAPQLSSSYHAKQVHVINSNNYGSLGGKNPGFSQALHIDTQSEPTPYRAMYKYQPQNEDELELLEGDTVYVLEKCDDGWYVGSSERTGAFGTFPGNYVEKI